MPFGTDRAESFCMLTHKLLRSTSDFLEARPEIDELIEQHTKRLPFLHIGELREWLFETTDGRPQHTLVYSAGEALGLVPRWQRNGTRQLEVGLGRFDGPIVIGRNRTLALLGMVRTLVADAGSWDSFVAAGVVAEGDLRRLETAARCERLPCRTIPCNGFSVVAAPSPAAYRARWHLSTASDASLCNRWSLETLRNSDRSADDSLTSAIPVLRVVYSDESRPGPTEEVLEESLSPAGSPAGRRLPATRPPLRVVRPS